MKITSLSYEPVDQTAFEDRIRKNTTRSYYPFSFHIQVVRDQSEIRVFAKVVGNKNKNPELEEGTFQNHRGFLPAITRFLQRNPEHAVPLTHTGINWHLVEFELSMNKTEDGLQFLQETETVSEHIDWWNHIAKKTIRSLKNPASFEFRAPGGCTLLEHILLNGYKDWISAETTEKIKEYPKLEGLCLSYGLLPKPHKKTGTIQQNTGTETSYQRNWWHFDPNPRKPGDYAEQVARMNQDQLKELDKPRHPKETAEALSRIIESEQKGKGLSDRTINRFEGIHRCYFQNNDPTNARTFLENMSAGAIKALSQTGTNLLGPQQLEKAGILEENPETAGKCLQRWLGNSNGNYLDPIQQHGIAMVKTIRNLNTETLKPILKRIMDLSWDDKSIPCCWAEIPGVREMVSDLTREGWLESKKEKPATPPFIDALKLGRGAPWVIQHILEDPEIPEELKGPISQKLAEKI